MTKCEPLKMIFDELWTLQQRLDGHASTYSYNYTSNAQLCCWGVVLQLGLRTLSVGLANNLLMNLPEPFKRSTFAAAAAQAAAAEDEAAEAEQAAAAAATTAAAAGGRVATPAPTRRPGSAAAASAPAGMVVAPWSVVALGALLQR
jgi:hypothetical protein